MPAPAPIFALRSRRCYRRLPRHLRCRPPCSASHCRPSIRSNARDSQSQTCVRTGDVLVERRCRTERAGRNVTFPTRCPWSEDVCAPHWFRTTSARGRRARKHERQILGATADDHEAGAGRCTAQRRRERYQPTHRAAPWELLRSLSLSMWCNRPDPLYFDPPSEANALRANADPSQ